MNKINIRIPTKQYTETTLELPYYYKCDLLLDEGDVIIYGKLELNKCTSIKTTSWYNSKCIEYEVIVENVHPNKYACYCIEVYKSTKEEFNSIRNKLLKFISDNE